MPTWLEQYLDHTEGLPTPKLFRLWAGISAIASALERKVWLVTSLQALYPNLFILLVAKPGMGKSQAIKPIRNMLNVGKCTILAPTDMTKAAFIDVLASSKRRILHDGQTIEYNPLSVDLTEFGTLINSHDLDFMSVINDAFDHEQIESQRRGHNEGKVISIKRPCLNVLAATQPHYLGQLLPEAAWHMGFTSRLIMVYSVDKPSIDLFADHDATRAEREAFLISHLARFSRLLGPFEVSDGAKALFRAWNISGIPPVPEHSRLAHYITRRGIYVMKLAMISAVSRTGALRLSSEDAEQARSWLLAVETLMPDIFRDMLGKGEGVLMNEVWRYAWNTWVQSARDVTRRTPLHKAELIRFLAIRCPPMVAEKTLDIMVQGDWFAQDSVNPSLYVPRPRGFSGEGG